MFKWLILGFSGNEITHTPLNFQMTYSFENIKIGKNLFIRLIRF